MSHEHLHKLKISYSGGLSLKVVSRSRAAETDSVGMDEAWSADRLYRHLCFLEGLVPRMVSMLDIESGQPFPKSPLTRMKLRHACG